MLSGGWQDARGSGWQRLVTTSLRVQTLPSSTPSPPATTLMEHCRDLRSSLRTSWRSGGTAEDGKWRPLPPQIYPSPAELHDLVEEAPRLLPLAGAPELTVLGREIRLGSGYADLLAVEASGRQVIIEVKLALNAESFRAVVAQVLSYAGYVQDPYPAQLETQILGDYLGRGESVLAAAQADERQSVIDPVSLAAGHSHNVCLGASHDELAPNQEELNGARGIVSQGTCSRCL